MIRWGLLTIVAALVVVGLLYNLVSQFNPERRNAYVFMEMAYSVAYETNSYNPNTPDRRTQQAAVPGTIARGLLPIHFNASPEDAVRAGEELVNPLAPDDPAALARGKVLFETFCVPCHGAGGLGDGITAQRGFPPPPSLLADHAKGLKDGQIFHIITFGQRSMSSYAAQVEREERWKLVNYVRSLQRGAP